MDFRIVEVDRQGLFRDLDTRAIWKELWIKGEFTRVCAKKDFPLRR